MSGWDEWAEAELERVMGGDTIRHPVHRHADHGGGEWDALLALDRPSLRTLVGARLLTPGGLHPDVAADIIAARVGPSKIPDVDAAVDWYVRTCLAAIAHRRRVAHWRRHHRLATRHGYPTYWYYRKDR